MKIKKEPIAIVGMACRFPDDCNNYEDFWEKLFQGKDFITEINANRWSGDFYFHPNRTSPGKTYTTHAGQVSNIYHFDPEFFGISPREAAQMDPQQRLLLQMTWEALEDGGQLPENLSGSDCSVFVGISSTDYANNRTDDPSVADSYFMTGNTLSIASNRISYLFNLKGPSMSIDTACSSSLVALHQACNSIWMGESSCSIVGSVHLLLSPFPYIGFSKASMLSVDGTCKVFDKDANGYVRSEGGAVLYLKPLEKAEQDNDPIHAVIHNTKVNTDGHKSGLTVPDGDSQSGLMDSVYREININPAKVDYVEAHGTGTPVGDPIETTAIGKVFGSSRSSSNPIPIGSVKSNLGHLEPASGFAGMLKVILSIKNRCIPASIHFQNANPNIDFQTLNTMVVDKNLDITNNEPLLMGVNSFGFGGSNAHIIVGEYQSDNKLDTEEFDTDHPVPPLYITAQSKKSLKFRTRQYLELLKKTESIETLYNIFYSASHFHQPLRFGLISYGDSYREIKNQIEDYCDDRNPENTVENERHSKTSKITFVYSGNGSQWLGMAANLIKNEVFRNTIVEIDEEFIPLAGWSMLDFLDEQSDIQNDSFNLDNTEIAQPLLFGIQAGITRIYKKSGIIPTAVVGHSVGEIAAAWASGALSIKEAVNVIYFRSLAQANTKGQGKMAAIQLGEEAINQVIELADNKIELAAINSPKSSTVSGPGNVIQEVARRLKKENIFCRVLDIDYPFHHKLMDSAKEYFLKSIGSIFPKTSSIDFYSTVTGNILDGEKLTVDYWWKNIRLPVNFCQSINNIIDDGCSLFVEIGPHPVLQSYLRECLNNKYITGNVITTLKRNVLNEEREIKKSIFSSCLLLGKAPKNFFEHAGKFTRLPDYPWDNNEYIFQTTNEAKNKVRDHILLGYHSNDIDGLWQNQIDTYTHPLLAHHIIDKTVLFPAAGYAEMALAASKLTFDRQHHEIANLEIRRPLVINNDETKEIQFALNSGDLNFSIKSRTRLSTQSWKINAVGRLINAASNYVKPKFNLNEFKQRSRYGVHGLEIYENAELLGLNYGEMFRAVNYVWVGNNELLSSIVLPSSINTKDYIANPVILDAAFHTLFPVFAERRREYKTPVTPFLPVAIEDLRFYGKNDDISYCLCCIHSIGKQTINASFILMDITGEPNIELRGCLFRRFQNKAIRNSHPKQYSYQSIPKEIEEIYSPPYSNDTSIIVNNLVNTISDSEAVKNELQFNNSVSHLYDKLASAISENVLRQLGAHLKEFTIESLITSAGISQENRNFIHYMLNILEEDGKIVSQDNQWKFISKSNDADSTWCYILENFPQCVDDMLFTASHGFNIVQNLTNNSYEDKNNRNISWHLQRHNTQRLSHQIFRNIISTIIKEWDFKKNLFKTCFIGYDSVSLVKSMINSMSINLCEHTILLDDEDTVSLAQSELSKYPNISIKLIDFTTRLSEQGLNESAFDIVLLANELHKHNHPNFLLSGINYLLESDGILMVSERIPDRLKNINNGIEPSWWITQNENKPVSRLKDPQNWQETLERQGFLDVCIVTDKILPASRESVLFAKRPRRETYIPVLPHINEIQTWLIITDGDSDSLSLGEKLSSRLRSSYDNDVFHVNFPLDTLSTKNSELFSKNDGLHEYIDKIKENCIVIYITNATLAKNMTGADINNLQKNHCISIKNLINLLDRNSNIKSKKICFLCFSENNNGYESKFVPLPEESGIWGFARVLRNEYPDIHNILISIKNDINKAGIIDDVIREAVSNGHEDEIVLSDQGRNVLRLKEISGNTDVSVQNNFPEYFQLGFNNAGNLDELHWYETEKKKPGYKEVEIKVIAAGLNFRDIMYASGLLPDEMLEDGFAGATLGLECSGVITSIGEDVNEFSVGESVITFAPACFASHVIAPITTVVKKPEQWSFESAATIPAAFFTVFYALSHLANLKRGEKVLIHGATGGVGLAAIQYAKYCNAEIFATAGTDEKRKFLGLLGVNHIFNSRSLEFADQIMEITHGEGVDVVLNSLAGEAIDKSLSVLRPCGRFLELGKRDYFENTKIGLRPFRHNITYFGVDADQLIKQEPDLSRHLFKDMMKLFEKKAFTPLVHTVFLGNTISDAFRLMKQSHHVGKIIVSLQNRPTHIRQSSKNESYNFHSDGTYIITGGLSGFGFETAKWLAEKQAGNLVLIGRREIQSDEIKQSIESLKSNGINVIVKKCDITDPVALQRILREIKNSFPPIKGIIHSAMVLEDCLIKNMSVEKLEAVMKPKIQGAWNLHQLTLDLNLDFFVMYSSIATCIGNPGQANYVAANMYLESLAMYRRSIGLTGLAVCWDAIIDSGYLSRNKGLRDALCKKAGIHGITTTQALITLENLLLNNNAHCIVINPSWEEMKRNLPALKSNKFNWVLHGISSDSISAMDENIIFILGKLSDEKKREYIANIVAEKVSRILKLPLNNINYNLPLHDMGIDSLMAMELALTIEEFFGVEISLMSLADSATINTLSNNLVSLLLDQLNESEENSQPVSEIIQLSKHVDITDQSNINKKTNININ